MAGSERHPLRGPGCWALTCPLWAPFHGPLVDSGHFSGVLGHFWSSERHMGGGIPCVGLRESLMEGREQVMGGLSEDCGQGTRTGQGWLWNHQHDTQIGISASDAAAQRNQDLRGPGEPCTRAGPKSPLYRRVGIRRQVLLRLGHRHGGGNLLQHHARPRQHRALGPLSVPILCPVRTTQLWV